MWQAPRGWATQKAHLPCTEEGGWHTFFDVGVQTLVLNLACTRLQNLPVEVDVLRAASVRTQLLWVA